MRHLFAAPILLLYWVGLVTVFASPPQSGNSDMPCQARRIYIDESRKADEEVRFRQELKRELTKKRFVVVARAEDADGTLSGLFSQTGSGRESKLAFESGELKDGRGGRLWHGNFYFTHASTRNVASAVAANLRDRCRR